MCWSHASPGLLTASGWAVGTLNLLVKWRVTLVGNIGCKSPHWPRWNFHRLMLLSDIPPAPSPPFCLSLHRCQACIVVWKLSLPTSAFLTLPFTGVSTNNSPGPILMFASQRTRTKTSRPEMVQENKRWTCMKKWICMAPGTYFSGHRTPMLRSFSRSTSYRECTWLSGHPAAATMNAETTFPQAGPTQCLNLIGTLVLAHFSWCGTLPMGAISSGTPISLEGFLRPLSWVWRFFLLNLSLPLFFHRYMTISVVWWLSPPTLMPHL